MKRNFKIIAASIVVAGLFSACVTRPVKRATKKEASQEVHLKEDRQKLEAIRKDIPPETREFNDETSLILNLFNDSNKSPSEIQSRFYSMTNKKRDEFSKKERRKREDYSEGERTRREKFSEDARREREKSSIDKMTKEERSRFFSEQDTQRRRFYSDQMDARRNFESQLREERQDFEAHLRDMRSRFDSEYRNYLKSYSERKKAEAHKSKYEPSKQQAYSSEAPPPGFSAEDMKDLETIPKNAKPLSPSDSE